MNKLKVLISGLFIACIGIGVVSAQNGTTATPAAAKKTTTKTTKATDGSTAAKPTQHLKKDGTPDMRYKENKAAAKSTGTAAPAEKKSTGTKKAAPKKAATSNSTM